MTGRMGKKNIYLHVLCMKNEVNREELRHVSYGSFIYILISESGVVNVDLWIVYFCDGTLMGYDQKD